MREIIKEKLQALDNLANTNYKELEVALMLFLRSDLESFDDLTDEQLDEIFDLTDNCNSLLDINSEDIDNILW